MCHRNRILHRIQLHRTLLKTGCPFARQLDYSHTGHIWSHGNIGQYCVLQVLQQESLQVHQHCTFRYLRLPHAASGSRHFRCHHHTVVCAMGHGIYRLERGIAGRNDKQFSGRSHIGSHVHLFRSHESWNSFRHLYRRSGMYTPFHFGHRLCWRSAGLADFCLLEQDCQKANEGKVSVSVRHA